MFNTVFTRRPKLKIMTSQTRSGSANHWPRCSVIAQSFLSFLKIITFFNSVYLELTLGESRACTHTCGSISNVIECHTKTVCPIKSAEQHSAVANYNSYASECQSLDLSPSLLARTLHLFTLKVYNFQKRF